MKKAPGITRTDDLLIWIGGFFCFFGFSGLIAATKAGGPAIAGPAFFAAGGVVSLVFGMRVRRRERRIQALWRMLTHALEVRIGDATASTGLSTEELREAVQVLNGLGHGFWVLDERAGTIVDARLRATVTAAAACTSCGATTSRTVALSSVESARCEHCGAPFPVETLNRLKLEAMESIRQPAVAVAAPGAPGGYNPVVGLVLLVVFWPVGLVYYLKHHGGIGRRG